MTAPSTWLGAILPEALEYGIEDHMSDMRKITAFIPADLLATAQANTGEGVSETLRMALEKLNHAAWSRRMLELRGKVRFADDLDRLREDREFDAGGNVAN
ncbi:MAG: hypothetical protein ACREEW_08025 [Caulobacteraceae bacterium]